MAVQIVAPKLGMSLSDVTMVEWKVKEGEKVEKGTAVLVIETEKTEWNVEAGASGFLHILVQEGAKAKIGQVVGLIAEGREELEILQKEPPRESLIGETKVKESPLPEDRTRWTSGWRRRAYSHLTHRSEDSGRTDDRHHAH